MPPRIWKINYTKGFPRLGHELRKEASWYFTTHSRIRFQYQDLIHNLYQFFSRGNIVSVSNLPSLSILMIAVVFPSTYCCFGFILSAEKEGNDFAIWPSLGNHPARGASPSASSSVGILYMSFIKASLISRSYQSLFSAHSPPAWLRGEKTQTPHSQIYNSSVDFSDKGFILKRKGNFRARETPSEKL